MRSNEVPEVARRQSGAFSAKQALSEGWSVRQIRRRLATGRWIRLGGDGLAAAETERSPEALAWAVHLTDAGLVVSHATAGALHGFPVRSSAPPQASSPIRRRSRRLRLFTWRVPVTERHLLAGRVALTSPTRTAIDCLATTPRPEALALYAWLVARRLIGDEQLQSGISRYASRDGARTLRYLHHLGRRGAASVAESLAHDLLDEHGITGWRANVLLRDDAGIIGVVDLLFEAEGIVVEIDGWESHRSRDAFQRDRQKQARLVAAGYVVLRMTWQDLQGEGRTFVSTLHRALAVRRATA